MQERGARIGKNRLSLEVDSKPALPSTCCSLSSPQSSPKLGLPWGCLMPASPHCHSQDGEQELNKALGPQKQLLIYAQTLPRPQCHLAVSSSERSAMSATGDGEKCQSGACVEGSHGADGSREVNLELPGGIVLETIQPVDGGRWGKTWFIFLPGFAFFSGAFISSSVISLDPSYYYTFIPSPPLILSSFPPFVSIHTISELLTLHLLPYKSIPSSFTPAFTADPKISPWHWKAQLTTVTWFSMEELCLCHVLPLSFSTLPLSCFPENTRDSPGAWGAHSPVTAVMSLLDFFLDVGTS